MNSINYDSVLRTIGNANRAALCEIPWEVALTDLKNLIGGEFANLEIVDLKSGSYIDLQSSDSIETNVEYLEHYHAINPRVAKLMKPGRNPIATDYDMFTEAEINKSEFYSDFLRPSGLRYFVGMTAKQTPDLFAGFSIQRTRNQGHIDNQHLQVLEVIYPHLQKAIQTFLKFRTLKQESQQLKEGLNQINDGVAIIAKGNRVTYCNSPFENMIESALFDIQKGYIRFAEPDSQQAFESAINRIFSNTDLSVKQPGSFAVKWNAPPGIGTAVLSPFSPGRHSWLREEGGREQFQDFATLTISPPNCIEITQQGRLIEVYKLTPAEAELAIGLAGGASLKEMASRRNVYYSTVRSQLRQIMGKLGVNRQAELVQKLHTL